MVQRTVAERHWKRLEHYCQGQVWSERFERHLGLQCRSEYITKTEKQDGKTNRPWPSGHP
jgi:hypothetical protein